MIEVELKARVADPEATRSAVESFADYIRDFDRRDAYFHGHDWRANRGKKGFRIRVDDGKTVVTFKTKRAEGGIEINREREFEVSDPEAFGEFIARLDCEPFINKRKRGRAYRFGELTIELVEVDALGHFIEIEKLLADEEPRSIALAQGEIRSALSLAGIPESAIEGKSYSELLIAAGA
jgi:adenylate cyclase class 2